jgi:hypothetical protein
LDAPAPHTLGNVAERIDAVLSEAARTQPTYLDFLDRLLCDEMSAKQRRRICGLDPIS